MNFTIIQLKEIHTNACFDLDQKSLRGLWTRSQWNKELSDPKRICIGIIEVETKQLLGLCSSWLVIDELQITSFAIHPTYQRQGLGKIILSNLIKRANSLSINYLHLEVKETNEPAKAFYKSMGFKVVGNRPELYKDGNNALIFTKKLTNT